MFEDVLFTCEKNIGVVTLNRPNALNSLTVPMILALQKTLTLWKNDPNIHAVIIHKSEGNAFCAGGDVRWLYEAGLNKDPNQMEFFKHEYQLNQLIHDYPKPYIALMDGITMGGGVGISLHGAYPVASDSFIFAMPETTIGFFPDIGASYLLAQIKNQIGTYLGLTGQRLNAMDAYELGLVKHVIRTEDVLLVIKALLETDLSINADERVTDCLNKFVKPMLKTSIPEWCSLVEPCFKLDTVEEIIAALNAKNSDWHRETAQNLQQKSPLSLKVTLMQLQKAKNLSLAECLSMDFCLVKHFMRDHDFYEGVRALLVDKDKSPKWQPCELGDVPLERVCGYFRCTP